jgi:ribosome-associated heat shock protein Hsp15
VRLDVWLDIACLFKTRSDAQRACRGGKVDVNGQAAKPHRNVEPGDRIVITRRLGFRQRLLVLGLAERHLPKARARQLYEAEALTPSEIERRRLASLGRDVPKAARRAPDKRERRTLRRLKEGG